MRKIILIGIFLMILSFKTGIIDVSVRADELEDINNKLSELNATLQSSEKATAINEKQLTTLTSQLASIKSQVVKIEQDVVQKEKEIKTGEERLISQKKILDERVASFYKQQGKSNDAMLQILVSDNLTKFLKQFTYQQNLLDGDRKTIVRVVLFVKDIEEKKIKLESEKERLIPIKEKIDEQSAFLEGEVLSAKKYENTIKSEIASLSAKQQQIINQRQASLNIPRSAGASGLYCTDDHKRNPGPGNWFAFYTFGIPHYVGMSQYGAYGRAKDNQDYKKILLEYYPNSSIECRDMPPDIDVEGYGLISFEDYIKGVVNKEMGADLPEALKAQAIAARGFAINETKPICTSQSCQVYSPSRREAANSAVDATGVNACGSGKAEVVVSGGSVAKTWYASTFGGYAHTSGQIWGGERAYTRNFADTNSHVGSFTELRERAYDRESSCFYTAQGWRDKYDKSAWLMAEEVADIANVILLVRKDSSAACFVYQTDKAPPGPDKECPQTGNWSAEEIRNKLGGQAISSAASVEITGVDWGSGITTQVRINGINFDGNEFKNYFNVRAPANLQIVGPLFNVERK